MEQLIKYEMAVTYSSNNITYDFTDVDAQISELERRYSNYIVSDKKEAKELCKELKAVVDGLKKRGIEIEKEASKGVKQFRKELKEREDRVAALRNPIWEEVKPQPKSKVESNKKGINVKVCYLFEGDSDMIAEILKTALSNDIKVTEVKF